MLQYDYLPGYNFSSQSSVTAVQILQAIAQIEPLSNIGGVISQSTTPDVLNNPRFARYLWADTTTDPAILKQYNAGAGTWGAATIPALSITNGEISASAAIAITKLATGTARYVLRTNIGATANEFVAPTSIFNTDELPVIKLTSNGGTDGYLKSVAGQTVWISNAVERAAIAASLSAVPAGAVTPGANNTILGTNGAGTVLFDSPANLLINGAITLPLLNAGGASAGDILYFDGANWVKKTPTIQIFNTISINTGLVVGVMGGSAIFTQAHGLGAKPSLVRVVMLCNTADLGYTAGDELDIFCIRSNATNNNSSAVTSDATNIVITLTSAAGNEIPNKGTGSFAAMAEANWSLKIYAWR